MLVKKEHLQFPVMVKNSEYKFSVYLSSGQYMRFELPDPNQKDEFLKLGSVLYGKHNLHLRKESDLDKEFYFEYTKRQIELGEKLTSGEFQILFDRFFDSEFSDFLADFSEKMSLDLEQQEEAILHNSKTGQVQMEV